LAILLELIQTAGADGMTKSLCRNISSALQQKGFERTVSQVKKKECGRGTCNDSKTKGIGCLYAQLRHVCPDCGELFENVGKCSFRAKIIFTNFFLIFFTERGARKSLQIV
jgi:hypothetical protein